MEKEIKDFIKMCEEHKGFIINAEYTHDTEFDMYDDIQPINLEFEKATYDSGVLIFSNSDNKAELVIFVDNITRFEENDSYYQIYTCNHQQMTLKLLNLDFAEELQKALNNIDDEGDEE